MQLHNYCDALFNEIKEPHKIKRGDIIFLKTKEDFFPALFVGMTASEVIKFRRFKFNNIELEAENVYSRIDKRNVVCFLEPTKTYKAISEDSEKVTKNLFDNLIDIQPNNRDSVYYYFRESYQSREVLALLTNTIRKIEFQQNPLKPVIRKGENGWVMDSSYLRWIVSEVEHIASVRFKNQQKGKSFFHKLAKMIKG